MKTQAQLVEYLRARPGITNVRACSNLGKHHGVCAADVQAARSALAAGSSKHSACPISPRRSPGAMSVTEFTQRYDSDTRTRIAIENGLLKILPDEIYADHDFRNLCGSPPASAWRTIASEDKFKGHQWTTKGKVYWASKSVRNKMLATIAGSSEI